MIDAQLQAISRLRLDLSDPDRSEDLPRGVIGACAADGRPRHAYPEIAGYWLRWASNSPDLPQATATAVIDALAVLQLPSGLWPTRTGLGGERVSPHYAQQHYLYDHAMLWDGLRHWAAVRRCSRAALLADGLWNALDCFVVYGRLSACISCHEDHWRDRLANGVQLDQGQYAGRSVEDHWRDRLANGVQLDQGQYAVTRSGWSSVFGPFMLKALARLLPGQGAFARLCADSADELTELALQSPHPQSHPQLYAIEGLIELGQSELARQALRRLLVDHGGAEAITEHVDGGPRRSDVLAQLLRAACVLGVADERDPGWSRLAAELAARVDHRGRLPFANPDDDRPTWAGLFALQALQVWSGQPLSGKELI